MQRARAVVLSWLALAVLARGVTAQTCPYCPAAGTMLAHMCTPPGVFQEGEGCKGELKNCQTPELLPPRIRIISSGNTFEAQLAVEARAPWNSDISTLSAGRIKLFWGPFDMCENGATDRPETYLAFPGLTCAAPG